MSGLFSHWKCALCTLLLITCFQPAQAGNSVSSHEKEKTRTTFEKQFVQRFTKIYNDGRETEFWEVRMNHPIPFDGGSIEVVTTIQKQSKNPMFIPSEVRRYSIRFPNRNDFHRFRFPFFNGNLVNMSIERVPAHQLVHLYYALPSTSQFVKFMGIILGMPMLDAYQLPIMTGKPLPFFTKDLYFYKVRYQDQALSITLERKINNAEFVRLIRIESSEWILDAQPSDYVFIPQGGLE